MAFVDRVLKCIDCRAEFVFTSGEQLFFYERQFSNNRNVGRNVKRKETVGGVRSSGNADYVRGMRHRDFGSFQALGREGQCCAGLP
jgi:hypothetical protein